MEFLLAMFQSKSGLSKDAFRKLLNSKQITPKHDRPASLTGDGYGGSTEPHEYNFFDWFDRFAEPAHRQMSEEPWRFQEKSNTLLSSFFDSPSYGRRYDIFHNHLKVGLIEISADLVHEFTSEEPNVDTHIELLHVRLLQFNEVLGFLNWVAGWLAVDDTGQVPLTSR
jgi:hypothetical protein